jgi:signal transduction histidine kinase
MLGEKLDIQYVNMHDVVEEKITLHGTFIKNKKIKVLNRIKAEDHALVDKTHIKIIIQNLLSNAIKFSYPEGIITIKSQIVDKMIKVSVVDNGKGISEEQINNLFEIQYATTTGTAGEKGNGLGLHLVKLLVEKNNGKIGVASEVGKGSEFYFLLPCKE